LLLDEYAKYKISLSLATLSPDTMKLSVLQNILD